MNLLLNIIFVKHTNITTIYNWYKSKSEFKLKNDLQKLIEVPEYVFLVVCDPSMNKL